MRWKILIIAFSGLLLSYCGAKQEERAPLSPAPNKVEKETVSSDPLSNKGIGPITSVTLAPEIDPEMAAKGKDLYQTLCSACHKENEKFIGPPPKGIFARRSPEWIMNMILNPEVMIKEDPIAKQLLIEYNMAPMANQGLTEDQARQILEYFRTL